MTSRAWLRLAAIGCVSLCLSPIAGGGTGAGNEFNHFLNSAFDFHLAAPDTWPCTGCPQGTPDNAFVKEADEASATWNFASPGSAWIHVTFTAGFPANSDQDLLTQIEALNPGVAWFSTSRGGFNGYTSSSQGDNAVSAQEYYFAAQQQIISIAWQRDPLDPGSDATLDKVKATIIRISDTAP